MNQRPAEIRRANLWAKYRITPEQCDALRTEQGYRCGICGIDEVDVDLTRVGGRPRADGQPLLKVPFAVDHDHKPGVIRGLLCPSCNAGLGAYCDDPSRLKAAIDYLQRASAAAFRAPLSPMQPVALSRELLPLNITCRQRLAEQ